MRDLTPQTELKLFDEYREKLLGMVTQSVEYAEEMQTDEDFSHHGDRIVDELRYSQRILAENIMPASLFSDFQKGKSTTTVAMADGHEITPCGKGGGGIRLSAVPMTIYHDKNSTQLKINLYSNEKLVSRILQVAGEHLEQTENRYDLDNEEDRAILKAAVCREIQVFQQSNPKENSYDPERLNILRSAILIIALYGTPAHQALINGGYKSINDVQPFISFSLELEKKWANLRTMGFDIVYASDEKNEELFPPKEQLYVFVESIVVPVHSEFMEETGTAVIDAPGTMASIEDTERALKAAREAAVVLYILNGESQLSQSDVGMLKVLRNAGMAEKVVFVINFRRNPLIIQQEGGVEEAILSGLEQNGYTMEHHRKLLYYNAFLAVRAAQGKLIMEGKLDKLTEDAIVLDAQKRLLKFNGTEEAWKKTTSRVLRAVDADDAADNLAEKGLCQETIDEILAVSQWREMIDALRTHVMKSRIGGILRDLGARPVISALKDIEGTLTLTEKAVTSDADEARKRYDKASKKLDMFAEKTNQLLERHFPESIDSEIARDYFDNVILSAVSLAAQDAAPEVFKATGLIGQVKNLGSKIKNTAKKIGGLVNRLYHPTLQGNWGNNEKAPDYLEERCQAIIKAHMQKAMMQKATEWSGKLEKTPVYQLHIRNNVLDVSEKMRHLWKELGLEEEEKLANIKPVPDQLTGEMSVDILNAEIRTIMLNTQVSANLQVSGLIKCFGAGMGAMVGLAYLYYFVLPLDFIIPGFAELLMIVSAAVAALVYAVSAKKKNKEIDKMAVDISRELTHGLIQSKEKILRSIATGEDENGCTLIQEGELGVSSIRLFYVTLFKALLEAQRKELSDNEQNEMEILKLSNEERERIALKAEKWREEKIKPLRCELDGALAEISEIWA